MSLPEADRDYLANVLWRSVHGDPEFDSDQIEEWDRRLDDLRSGRAASLTYEQFFEDNEPR